METTMLGIATITVLLAFAFTFTNGFQDASSIAATFIASRSASPRNGILLVTVMALLGAILGGSAVAFTLSGLLAIESGPQTVVVLMAGLIAAIAWNCLTWKYGLPSSSTHALIGGLVGAGIMCAGMGSVHWGVTELLVPPHELVGFVKILTFLIASVALGFAVSFILHKITNVLLRNAKRTLNRSIIRLNWVAAAVMSFANGANDSQKQMGIIALVLFAAGQSATLDIPSWARVMCALFIGAGTLTGGWRIMKTLGCKIFRIEPIHSFDSQVSSGMTIAVSTIAGAPISTTHIIASSVLGVGSAEGLKRVQWSIGKEILMAMVLTIPVTTLIAAAIYLLISPLTGV
jgi:PiT family inorganic phosphate transporter